MRRNKNKFGQWLGLALSIIMLASGCATSRPTYIIPEDQLTQEAALPTSTPFPTRPVYEPGTLVDYIAQSGDTLPLLAVRFGTTEEEIRSANPVIPEGATTMPPGFPMKMPIYYKPLWGTDYQIIPDAAFVYGPDLLDFDLEAFLGSTSGWFKTYSSYIQAEYKDAAALITWICENYSLNPKLLLALLEYQSGALTNPVREWSSERNLLIASDQYTGAYLQIYHVADLLNDGYYRYRLGELTSIEHLNGQIENIDPWQNAATAALQRYFSLFLDGEDYLRAIGPDGYAKTYQELFGDPWSRDTTVLPGSLSQPEFILPFMLGTTWSYTGGPHTGWGNLKPWAALDFAPPSATSGCVPSGQYAVAVADGVISRVGVGTVMLDLDGDGDERTGWNILYLHIAEADRITESTEVKQGDLIGHPSCEGGNATGTHVHIARKYNGEWIPAVSVIPFNLEGWTPVEGASAYQGQLVRGNDLVTASTKSDSDSMLSR
ncbi:MAG: LysM peptidoglycan-binding domain-containing M23 family metallopeptidase [Anaerolineaceae bacterium]